MRRVVDEDPVSGAALWARRLALVGIGLVGGSVAASRAGAVPPATAMAILHLGVAGAGLALCAALVGAVTIWRTGRPGLGPLGAGVTLALLAIAGPAWFALTTAGMPALADISTAADGPAFSDGPAAIARRRGTVHPPVPAGNGGGQSAAYPDVQPLMLDVDPAEAFAAALKLVRARRWTLLATMVPKGPQGAGQIEAVAKTPVMGFPCDVAIRVASAGPGRSRVDIRSAARWTGADGGDGAARIAAFATDLEDAVDE